MQNSELQKEQVKPNTHYVREPDDPSKVMKIMVETIDVPQ